MNGKKANEETPLWSKAPSETKEEEYKTFYQKLFPFNADPLFWIHLNVDFPFNLKGILYFPKVMHELDANKGQVKLYCKQVFVSDNSKDVIPEFLTLLQGAIDCPDIPLNISRSYLQKTFCWDHHVLFQDKLKWRLLKPPTGSRHLYHLEEPSGCKRRGCLNFKLEEVCPPPLPLPSISNVN